MSSVSLRRRAMAAVVRKDLRVAFKSKAVLIPFIVVPLVFVLLLPIGISLIAPLALGEGADQVMSELESFSPVLLASLEGLNEAQKVVVIGLVYMMAPLFLIIPVMFASVLAADSFAGEKERKTLEALVYSPIADRDLLLAKMLSAWLPAVAVGTGSFVVYALAANIAAWPVMGYVFLPNLLWLVLIVWVMPAAAGVGLGVSVLVSARVSTFQEAYQLGSIVVLPIVALVVGQALGVVYLSVWLVAALGLLFWLAAATLIWQGGKRFRRSEMITRL